MNLFHLKCFCDAARSESLSEAARANLVTHSAASQAIRALEAQLGVRLLHHGKRRFQLSDEGRALLARAEPLLEAFEEMKREVSERSSEPVGEVVFGAPQSLVADAFTGSLRRARDTHPALRIRIRTGAAALVKNFVRERRCAFGVLVDDGDLGDFEQETLFSGQFKAVSASRRPDLLKEGLLVTDRDKVEVRRFLKDARVALGKDVPVNMEALSWSLLKKLCLEGLGCALLPDYVAREELAEKLLREVKSVPSAPRYAVKAIWPRKRELPRSARALLDMLKTR
jgi:DNA-binding transcriptional LysR family regulator